jgi:hypothetical protein
MASACSYASLWNISGIFVHIPIKNRAQPYFRLGAIQYTSKLTFLSGLTLGCYFA